MSDKQREKEQVDCQAGEAAADQRQDGVEGSFDKADIAAVMLELDDKNRQLEEVGNRLLRLQADFDNFRRRTRQEKEELSQVVTSGIVTQLLPVLDNFERALATAPGQDAGQLLAGVELVGRQFTQIMERLGIKPIVALGAQFDPALHEAVMRVEDACQPDGMVVAELQKGYMAHSKVLRPSMVKVVNNG
ncbi:MAG: nucleotide exchange factor GrpE [Negativicutes bacterium]|nr:nucleotide exchange factor GrpE [Negativicutes bacterium]